MQTRANKSRDSRGVAVADRSAASKHAGNSAVMLADNRPESLQLSKLQLMADNSPQVANAARLQAMADGSPDSVAQMMGLERLFGGPVQREGGLQMKAGPGSLQLQGPEEEEELQGKPEAQRQGALEADAVDSGAEPSIEQESGEQESGEEAPEAAPKPAAAEAASATGVGAATPAAPTGASTVEEQVPAEESLVAAAQGPEMAVSAQGGAGESGTAEVGATAAGESSPTSAEEDPAFQAVVASVAAVAVREQVHVPAQEASTAAQAAAAGPANEVKSMAAAGQVGAMDQQKPRPFNRAAFKAALMEKIAGTAPTTLEQADEFKSGNKLASISGSLTSTVEKTKDQAQGPIERTAKQRPDTSGVKPKPVTPLRPQDPGPNPPDLGAAQAAPKPKTEAEVSAPFLENSQRLDQQMAEAQITEEQLANSNEPEFQSALSAKQGAQADCAQAPGLYRQHEQKVLPQAEADAANTAQAQIAAMHGDRAQLLAQVTGVQMQSKSEDEKKRAQVANHIQSIYGKTKAAVQARLSKLDSSVQGAFVKGAEGAKKVFESYVDSRMKAYKKERYSGFIGKLSWVKDKLLGLPSEVNAFYSQGRALYIGRMNSVINRVVKIVETGLAGAKAIITQGRQKIQAYVAGLPQSLQMVGQEAASDIQDKFGDLEDSVNDKQGELVDTLAQKYKEGLQKVDSDIAARKEANKGLVDKAFDAVAGAIKTILELKNMLLSTLGRAKSVIMTIIADPIGFLGNLIGAVQLGLNKFMSKIGMYLQQGLMQWLTGAIASTGIKMPDKFDLKGIFSLVMQVLGLTYDAIRSLAVKALGERVVKGLETTFEIFKILVTKGITGLWEFVQAKIGDLKAMVMDKIKDLLITQVIKAGIKWIIGLLNPAAALIKACMAIYNIIKFIMTRGREIMAFVNSIIDSMAAIAKGNLSGAAKMVEASLAKAVPLLIGFLASLLGLNTIPAKVQAILETVRAPIRKAITWVLQQAKKFAMKMWGKLGFGKKKEKGKGQEADKPGPVGKIRHSFEFAGESHTLIASLGGQPGLVMSSEKYQKLVRREDLAAMVTQALNSDPDNTLLKKAGDDLNELKDFQSNIEQRKKKKRKGETGKGRRKKKGERLIKEYRAKLTKILNAIGDSLTKLAKKSKHLSEHVVGPAPGKENYYLDPKIDIRKRLYPGWDEKTEKWKEEQIDKNQKNHKLNKSRFYCPAKGHVVSSIRPPLELDHKVTVAKHWTRVGRHCGQTRRAKWYRKLGNLEVICKSCNAKKQGGGKFLRPIVGPDFRGPNDKKPIK